MHINSYWLDKEEYSMLEVAYLACGQEPKTSQQTKNDPDAKVISVGKDIKSLLVNHGYCSQNESINKRADSTPKCNPSCHAAFGKDSAKKTE